MSKVISRDSLTTYERWKLPDMDSSPDVQEPQSPAHARPDPQAANEAPSPVKALPTLEQVEAIQREAQEEGFAAGFREGRKEGFEHSYKKGHQKGQEKGYHQGLEEGLAAARDEINTQVEKFKQILDFMARPLQELDTIVEEELTQLAVAIARQLIRRELKTSPDEIVAAVRQAVSLLPLANQELQVHLHPEDAQLMGEVASAQETSTWHIVEDPALTRGGCTVVRGLSRIDASVEKRLSAVIATVLGDERAGS